MSKRKIFCLRIAGAARFCTCADVRGRARRPGWLRVAEGGPVPWGCGHRCCFFRGRISSYLGIGGDIASRRQLLVFIQKTIFTGTAGPKEGSRDEFWHCHFRLAFRWAADCGDLLRAKRNKNPAPTPKQTPDPLVGSAAGE